MSSWASRTKSQCLVNEKTGTGCRSLGVFVLDALGREEPLDATAFDELTIRHEALVVLDDFCLGFRERWSVLDSGLGHKDVDMKVLDGADMIARVSEAPHDAAAGRSQIRLDPYEKFDDLGTILTREFGHLGDVSLGKDEEHLLEFLVREVVFLQVPALQ